MNDASEVRWLRRVRDLAHLLAEETDLDRLLPAVLDAAIELSDAERGFLVALTAAGKPRVEQARGFGKVALKGAQGKISRTAIERLLKDPAAAQGFVTTDTAFMEITEATSVRDRRVRSIAAVPLRVRGELWGALYLDHRFTRSAFAAEDLAYLTTFAQHAALAIETAELRAKTRPASARLDAEALPPSPGAPRSADAARARCGPLVGASGPMQELYDGIERAARGGDAPVLIVGETGTGKELVARAIDALRAGPGPFVSQSCPALSEGTLEAELFGVRRGAYTGALDRRGLFARAEGGTLLLDEVGEASPRLQVTLLRVLQERCFRPLGAEREEPIRCRILTTTRHSLQRLVAEGSFREDLFYRLDVLRLNLPPLRERGADLELLVEALYPGAQAPRVRSDTWQLLRRHTWPGNVRELENEVLRWASAGLSEVLPQSLSQSLRESPQAPSSGRTLAALERDAIAAALVETGGNKAAAAKLLGIPRSTLNHRIRKQGLE